MPKPGRRRFRDERAFLLFAGGGLALQAMNVRAGDVTGIVGFPVGLVFALLLLLGPRAAPAAFAGAACIVWRGFHPDTMSFVQLLPLALVYASIYGGCAALLRRRAGKSGLLSDTPGVVRLIGGALTAALPAVVLGGAWLLWLGIPLAGDLNPHDRVAFLLAQWAREASGILMTAPLVILLFGSRLQRWTGSTPEDFPRKATFPSRAQLLEVVGLSLAVGLVLGISVLIRQKYGISAFYLAFLPVLAPVARHGLTVASLALPCSSVVSTWLWARLGWGAVLSVTDLRILLLSFAVTSLVLAALVDARKRASDDLASLALEFRALAAHTETCREQERTRIAREIHDELGQSLTGMKMTLSLQARTQSGESREKLSSLARDVDGIIQSVRQIATELRPGILDALGLPAAVEWLASDFRKRTGLPCHVSCVERVPLDRDRTTALFRVLQEALTNVTRHARAQSVTVLLEVPGEQVRLIVEDDGSGIPPDKLRGQLSLGLLGMRERTSQFGGDLLVERRQTGGTRVTASIPVAATEG